MSWESNDTGKDSNRQKKTLLSPIKIQNRKRQEAKDKTHRKESYGLFLKTEERSNPKYQIK